MIFADTACIHCDWVTAAYLGDWSFWARLGRRVGKQIFRCEQYSAVQVHLKSFVQRLRLWYGLSAWLSHGRPVFLKPRVAHESARNQKSSGVCILHIL